MTKKTPPTISRRSFNASLAALPVVAAGGVLAAPASVIAQEKYPSRPVTIVLPFGPGGVADVTSRLAAEKLSEKLGQRFVIENRPGAGGITAARSVLSARPDGYTLGLVTNGTAISAALFKALPFDPVKQFEMISLMGSFELVMITSADSPYKTLGDFIKAAKQQPGKLNVGTITVGGTQNLAAELLKIAADVKFQIIPHRTTPEVVVALLRKDVQLAVEFPAAVRGALNDGKARALATTGTSRSSALPDVPTVQEAGVNNYEVVSWNGFFAPSGTPKPIIETLNAALREILAEEDVKKRYHQLGVDAKSSAPEELKARLVADIRKWADVIAKAGIPKQ
jgi:tripartite-type tricarboxylate transporter receptor subunit TctC